MKRVRAGVAWLSCLVCLVCAAACSGAPKAEPVAGKPAPPPRPPSPTSVSVKEPGGDAVDAQQAALLRQLEEPWGARNDKDDQVLVPTPDWAHWKRVRFWGVEHLLGLRYGAEHHVLAIGVVRELPPGTELNTDNCMRAFEAWGRPQIKPFDVKFGPFSVQQAKWRDQRLMIESVDGELSTGFTRTQFSAAWAAYPAYPGACFVFAMAVPWRDHPDLAKKVRDRWVSEGFSSFKAKTDTKPVRK